MERSDEPRTPANTAQRTRRESCTGWKFALIPKKFQIMGLLKKTFRLQCGDTRIPVFGTRLANRYAVQNPEVSVFRTALRITKVPKTGNVEFDLDTCGL